MDERGTEREAPPLGEALGRAIQAFRAERGMKRKDLAQTAVLSYPYLSEIENGTKEPSTRVLAAIARALGLNLHELMGAAESLAAEIGTPGGRPASSPQPMRPPPASRSQWFHRLPAEPVMAHSTPIAPLHSFAEPDRRLALEELQALASRLDVEDLERLVALARRLAQR